MSLKFAPFLDLYHRVTSSSERVLWTLLQAVAVEILDHGRLVMGPASNTIEYEKK